MQKLGEYKKIIAEFLASMQQESRKVVCITSGGTAVPLEKNTVRLIENFSTGLRGSQLAEHYLANDHAVVFFYRDRSILPFTNGLTLNEIMLADTPETKLAQLQKAIEQQQAYKERILYVSFKTIHFYLAMALCIKQLLPANSTYILCAAVSDFVPEHTPDHKIQTSAELELKLKGSPKILGRLVREDVLTVSFKLETDEPKLEQRMLDAISRYRVHVVIGNILNRRQHALIRS